MKTNRSLFKYIFFTIITLGIYDLFFIQGISRDMNKMCAGDGERTRGVFGVIVLNLITCGIYNWVWWYNLGNRLARNARRYGCDFIENGGTVLMWMLFGSLICGIGPLVAIRIVCRNINEMAKSYNCSPFERKIKILKKVFA